MPAVTLGKGITPLERIEVGSPLAIGQLATHQVMALIEEVFVVHGMLSINLNLFLGLTQSLSQFIDAPIVKGILEGTGSTLVDAIVRYIAQLVIGLPLLTSTGGSGQVGISTMLNSLPQGIDIITAHTLQIGIGNYGC